MISFLQFWPLRMIWHKVYINYASGHVCVCMEQAQPASCTLSSVAKDAVLIFLTSPIPSLLTKTLPF